MHAGSSDDQPYRATYTGALNEQLAVVIDGVCERVCESGNGRRGGPWGLRLQLFDLRQQFVRVGVLLCSSIISHLEPYHDAHQISVLVIRIHVR